MALPGKTENKIPASAPNQSEVKEDKPVNTPAETLTFKDADEMPGAKELNQSSNPFQEKVNELSRTGKASYVIVATDRETWARTMIRRAANNIDKGTRTKVQKVEGDTTKIRVWFKVTPKVKRNESTT
jgi:hypothetical protein